jgi:Ferritin-like domain
MSNQNLATPELGAVQIEGVTRQSFILRGALATGAVYGLGAVGPFVKQAVAQDSGDVEVVNFALTLEYLEAGFYTEALRRVGGLSGEVKELATTLRENEDAHVEALTATVKDLGGTPAKKPKVDFGGAFANQKSFLKTAETFEDLGVSAYNGAAPSIQSKKILAAAGSIVQVEARHAAAIRVLNGKPPTAGGFDKALKQQQVLDKVKPFVKS